MRLSFFAYCLLGLSANAVLLNENEIEDDYAQVDVAGKGGLQGEGEGEA